MSINFLVIKFNLDFIFIAMSEQLPEIKLNIVQ